MDCGTWEREDYRELLELIVIFLGGVVKRIRKNSAVPVDIYIRKPGAVHQAHFMASCLYILKIFFYLHQEDFGLKRDVRKMEVQALAEFIALIYAPYFLQSPLAIAAPQLDHDLWNDLHSYSECFPEGSFHQKMINAAKESVLRHLWYLTEELVVLGLSENERKEMANSILEIPKADEYDVGKPRFPTELMQNNPLMYTFIGERSWIVFHKLEANGEWLNTPVNEWDRDEEYDAIKTLLKDLKVVNDPAERCIKDIQEYCNRTIDPSYRVDILLVATDHRGVFQDMRKQNLATLWNI